MILREVGKDLSFHDLQRMLPRGGGANILFMEDVMLSVLILGIPSNIYSVCFHFIYICLLRMLGR